MEAMELIELTKVCTGCGERKSWKEFYKHKKCLYGVNVSCKLCKRIRQKKYGTKNKDKKTIYDKIYRAENKNKIKSYQKIYQVENKDKLKIKQKFYHAKNKNKLKIKQRIYRAENKDRIKSYHKIYRAENKDKLNAKIKIRRKTDIKYKLNKNISTAIWFSLKKGNSKKGKSWKDIVPYTLNGLIKRLKKTLPKGYTWDDYINGRTDLHVDHKIPVSVHNFKSYKDTDFQRCWALKNLQLLPAKENIIKSNSLEKHFQPSLLLELKEG